MKKEEIKGNDSTKSTGKLIAQNILEKVESKSRIATKQVNLESQSSLPLK
jgi:hypothetical protein